MKLDKKKQLAARTLGVGKDRIIFNIQRFEDIKEAITKQDIRDLKKDGAIIVKEIKGSLSRKKRKTRRRKGSIKKKVIDKEQEYVRLTRKLRSHLAYLKKTNKISREEIKKLRQEIRAKAFKSLGQMKERLKVVVK